MKKFEYEVAFIATTCNYEKIRNELNEWGELGFEAVNMVKDDSGYRILFKREKG